jgi:hypothetical protein
MFAKVFDQIFNSSIAEDYVVRHVFMDLLVLADRDGVVDMTPESISRRTNVPLEIVAAAILKLNQPDKKSRSDHELGKRLVLIDSHREWGWQIVNYSHYRNLVDDESRRAYFRDKQREYRSSKQSNPVKDNKALSNPSNLSKEITQAEAEAEADTNTSPREKPLVGDKKLAKKKTPDPRHLPVREFNSKCYTYLNDKAECPWGPADAKQLDILLKRFPSLSVGEFHQWLLNYASSENINPSDPPYKFIPRLEQYRSGPLNQFGKPLKPNGGVH